MTGTGLALLTRKATPAATPCPLALAANRPGATAATCAVPTETLPSPLVMVMVAGPIATPGGSWKLIWPGATKKSGAVRSAPPLSLTLTLVPAIEVGSGNEAAACVVVASLTPKDETIDSGANPSEERKLAAETLATGLLIANETSFDVPPPGGGLKTVMRAAPAVAMSVAGIVAVNCVALTNAVVRLAPFNRTVEPLTKLEPLTASVKAAPPAVTELGLMVVMTGVGLG